MFNGAIDFLLHTIFEYYAPEIQTYLDVCRTVFSLQLIWSHNRTGKTPYRWRFVLDGFPGHCSLHSIKIADQKVKHANMYDVLHNKVYRIKHCASHQLNL